MNEPLLKSVCVRCDVVRAFEAFTEQIDSWWPHGHRRLPGSRLVLEAREGGRFFERSPAGEVFELGAVLECEAPHRLSLTWQLGAIDKPTRVDIAFDPDGEFTVVRVRHSEADSELGDAWPQRVALFSKGWQSVLAALETHLSARSATLRGRGDET